MLQTVCTDPWLTHELSVSSCIWAMVSAQSRLLCRRPLPSTSSFTPEAGMDSFLCTICKVAPILSCSKKSVSTSVGCLHSLAGVGLMHQPGTVSITGQEKSPLIISLEQFESIWYFCICIYQNYLVLTAAAKSVQLNATHKIFYQSVGM